MTDTEVLFISMVSTIAVVLLFLGGGVAHARTKDWRIRRASERRRRGLPQPPHLQQARRGTTNAMSQAATHAAAVAGRSLRLVGRKTRRFDRHATSVARWLTAVARRGTAAAERSLGLVPGKTRLSVRQRFARADVDTANVELVPSELVPELGSSRPDPIRWLSVSPRASESHVMSGSHARAVARDEPGSRVATDGRDAHPPRPPLPPNSDRPLTTKRRASDVEALQRKRNELTLSTKPENSGHDQIDLIKAKQVEGLGQSPQAEVELLKAKLRRPDRGHRR